MSESLGEIMRNKGINSVLTSMKLIQVLRSQGFTLPSLILAYEGDKDKFYLLNTTHPHIVTELVFGANEFAANAQNSPTARLRRPPGEFKSIGESSSSPFSSRSSSPTAMLPTLPTLSVRPESPPPTLFIPQQVQRQQVRPKLATIPPSSSSNSNYYDNNNSSSGSSSNRSRSHQHSR